MSDATGFGDRLLAHAVRWASESNGSVRPIDDPATRERLASIAIDNAITRLLRLRATWMAAQGELPSVEGSMAKLWGSERFVHATSEVLDLLGTDGLLVRGDQSAPAGGWLELAYREAVVMTIYGGTSEMQRRGIARERLGLRTA
jgi:alkylation response protein AidB-like acyl-CoA dehydrogenase